MSKISFTLLLLALAIPLFATHNFSGEITVRKTGPLTVTATITTWTKASSVNADRDSLVICWGDGQCLLIARSNGGGEGEIVGPDLKKSVYVSTHEYLFGNLFHISMTDPNRVTGIINVNYPSSEYVPFYLETIINLQADAALHSPILLEAPVDQALLYQPFVHVPNAFDLDGDSLSYALVTPFSGMNTPVLNYIYPDQIVPGPDNQLTLDPVTGKLTWDAPQQAGLYNIAIEIKAWRNGVLMEKVLRDMLIEVRESNNLHPVINLTPNYAEDNVVEVVVGQTVQIAVTASDPVQVVNLSASGGLLGNYFQQNAVFSSDNDGGVFTWTVAPEHVRHEPYTVLFKASDDGAFVPWPAFRMVRFRAKATSGFFAPVVVESLKTFPNPTVNGRTTLVLPNANGERLDLRVFNSSGQIILNTQLFDQAMQFPLDLSAWPSGLYQVEIQSPERKIWRTTVVR